MIPENGVDDFALRAALSSEGNTALLSSWSDNDDKGAAWFFARSGSTWAQQGSKVTGSEEVGAGEFGETAALSGEGTTAAIGGPEDNGGVGALWIYVHSGSTWAQQGKKLTVKSEASKPGFGRRVALAANGNTALVGGAINSDANAWVFTRSGSTWTQATALTSGAASGSEYGASVALSADGNTALVGAPAEDAVWVFTRSGSTWSEQAKLTGASAFGGSVAIASEGNTALIGDAGVGAAGKAWVFTRSGSTWTEQATLTGAGEQGAGEFGWGVAISPQGNIALVGAPADNELQGAAWLFSRSGSTWTQLGPKLTPSGGIGVPVFGLSLGISSEGSTLLIGGPRDNNFIGAAWVFDSTLPTVSKLEPSNGYTTGGPPITITGTNLTGATAVKFGAASAKSFTVNSETSITAIPPPGSGTAEVTVTTPEGTSPTSAADVFTYATPPPPAVTKLEPPSGPATGGTAVTITGEHMNGATAVKFGSNPATHFEVESESRINAVSPAGTETVDVTIETPGGTSTKSPADQFTYATGLETGDPQLYDNFRELKTPVGALGWGPITMTIPALETEVECLNLGFGSAWNEGSPSLGHGQVLGWSGAGNASKTGTELNRECKFKKGGSIEAWISDEPALTQSGGVGEHTGPLSVPWNVELRCGEREETQVTIVKIGQPNGAAPTPGCESEATEVGEIKKEEEERRGCYATPVPAGCIKVNVVQPALGLETVFEGSVRARVLDGSGNGLNASRLRFEEYVRENPTENGQNGGFLRLSTQFADKGHLVGEVKVSGLAGDELLQSK